MEEEKQRDIEKVGRAKAKEPVVKLYPVDDELVHEYQHIKITFYGTVGYTKSYLQYFSRQEWMHRFNNISTEKDFRNVSMLIRTPKKSRVVNGKRIVICFDTGIKTKENIVVKIEFK